MKTGDAVPFIGHLCPYGAVMEVEHNKNEHGT